MEENKTKEAWETPKLSVLDIDGTKHGAGATVDSAAAYASRSS